VHPLDCGTMYVTGYVWKVETVADTSLMKFT